MFSRCSPAFLLLLLSGAPICASFPSQTPTPPTAPAQEPSPQPPVTPAAQGTVVFQSHGEPPTPSTAPVDPSRKTLPVPGQETAPETAQVAPDAGKGPELSDRERGALLFTAYDLDARVTPASSKLTVRARVTVRNVGDEPLSRIALQVSSTLRWESVAAVGSGGAQALPLAQHLIDTDADHTGRANEALLELPAPLAPGKSLTLDTFYSGTAAQSGERLTRIGATGIQGVASDWDAISPGGVWLRGFGNVLWYPVSAPQMFLGEGSRLFDAADRMKLAQQATTVRLRLSVEYADDAPAAAYFCGRRAAFTAIRDAPDVPAGDPSGGRAGVATAEFVAEPLGFRMPSLFVAERQETMTAPLAGEVAGGEPMLAVESTDERAAPALASAAEQVAPLLQRWLGARPLSALTVLDHAGQPFQDGPLLVAPAPALTTSDALPVMAASLAHAWVQTGRPWEDEGLAQFFALLEVEQARGRDAMVAQLGDLLKPVVQPNAADSGAREDALVETGSEMGYRRKAAAVWLMLREIAGDQALEITLTAWRLRAPTKVSGEEDALALRDLLEKNSGKELHRFFEDWVLHARGLPELTLLDVAPRELPTSNTGRKGGWLTTVTVTNAGGAMADVPVIVRSGSFSTTLRLQVPGASDAGPGSATTRVQTESAPTEVQVNDGITPETRTSVHRRDVRMK